MDIADAKANNVNIWLSDLKHGTNSRFTFDTSEDVGGVWSRDGSLIAYRSLQSSDTNVFLKQAQGLQPPRCHFLFKQSAHATDDLDPTPGHSTTSNCSAPCSPPREDLSSSCFPRRAAK